MPAKRDYELEKLLDLEEGKGHTRNTNPYREDNGDLIDYGSLMEEAPGHSGGGNSWFQPQESVRKKGLHYPADHEEYDFMEGEYFRPNTYYSPEQARQLGNELMAERRPITGPRENRAFDSRRSGGRHRLQG